MKPIDVSVLPLRLPRSEWKDSPLLATRRAALDRLMRIMSLLAVSAALPDKTVRAATTRFLVWCELAFADIRVTVTRHPDPYVEKCAPPGFGPLVAGLDPDLLRRVVDATGKAHWYEPEEGGEARRLRDAVLRAAAEAEPRLRPFIEAEIGP